VTRTFVKVQRTVPLLKLILIFDPIRSPMRFNISNSSL